MAQSTVNTLHFSTLRPLFCLCLRSRSSAEVLSVVIRRNSWLASWASFECRHLGFKTICTALHCTGWLSPSLSLKSMHASLAVRFQTISEWPPLNWIQFYKWREGFVTDAAERKEERESCYKKWRWLKRRRDWCGDVRAGRDSFDIALRASPTLLSHQKYCSKIFSHFYSYEELDAGQNGATKSFLALHLHHYVTYRFGMMPTTGLINR